MNNYKDIELIEKFRSGTLNEQEVFSFNERLNTDSAFKELHDDFFESEKILKFKELWAVKEELNKYDYSIDEEGRGSRGKWILGVSVLLLVASGGIYFFSGKSYEKKDMYISSDVSTNNKQIKLSDDSIYQNDRLESTVEGKILAASVITESRDIALIEDDSIMPQVDIAKEGVPSVKPSNSVEVKNCNENPKVDFLTKGTCSDENNGIVIIKDIKGSYSPYKIIKDSSEVYQGKATFKGLKHGRHLFYVLDNRDCKVGIPVIVEKIDCIKEETVSVPPIQNYLIYLPGQAWKIPMRGKGAQVEIRDQKGSLIFMKEVLKEENDEWTGVDMNSREVEPGVYFFLLKEEGEKDRTGNITVLK